ncbi:MAG: glucose-6-phosphate dehydrogenase [Candidatus Omnitrophica bacterium]|nr:glucose-6-phosphate dehydrogenase [Candidatus Omnitrophota bacterium]
MYKKVLHPESPTILIVLGATGDLITKKIIPSVCQLYLDHRLPQRFCVVGMARRPFANADFQKHVQDELSHKLPDIKPQMAQEVSQLFTYHQGDFADPHAFASLKEKLEKIDLNFGVCTNKLFYLAVPPSQFAPILKSMVKVRLNIPCGGKIGWTRLLVEKPFGENTTSAKALSQLFAKYFKNEQLYFIDHYLAKDIVQAIIHFRFSNNLFEKSWDKHTIEQIDISLNETLGVEDRGAFYDAVGTFRDVGQNHLLQMLAAITMNCPSDNSATNVRNSRADIMETLKPWTLKDIRQKTFRAQYDEFLKITSVKPNSQTETYFKLQTALTHPNWSGVPITLESGKACPAAKKQVIVTFKRPKSSSTFDHKLNIQNRVIFNIEPDDRISIHFWAPKPGLEQELEERTLDFFLYEHVKKIQYVAEYSELILNCLVGDQSMFVSHREIMAQWKFTDPVIEAWRKNIVPLNYYQPKTDTMIKDAVRVDPTQKVETMTKTVGMIGLGKMGMNMTRRLMEQGWKVVGFDRSAQVVEELKKEGMIPAFSLKELTAKLSNPKIIWIMVPAGKPVDEVIFGTDGLIHDLTKNDFIIDGGNSFFEDTIKRAKKIAKTGIRFLDCGTSGGPGGARKGACLMIGGKKADFVKIEQLFSDLALSNGYQFFEGSGAGHFVKMVHNGIEYGMMQSIAEGFAIMNKSKYNLDLTRIADIYNHGSVIESRLIQWLEDAYNIYGEDLKAISGKVQHSGEGAWTAETGKKIGLDPKIIRESLMFRKRSQKKPSYTGQIVSALRGQFGGHPVLKKKKANNE